MCQMHYARFRRGRPLWPDKWDKDALAGGRRPQFWAAAIKKGWAARRKNQISKGELMTLTVGQRVLKHSGDYQLEGEIRAVFTTKAGKVRYVVEHEPGFLHIYAEANLKAIRL